MFPSPSTSTPFSVKDILNLEQSHDVIVSSLGVSPRMDCCAAPTSSSSSSSCMLARLKQEPQRDMSTTAASMFGEDPQDTTRGGRGNALCFPATFYGKSFMEMDAVKGGKSDAFEGKRRKGELNSDFFFTMWPCTNWGLQAVSYVRRSLHMRETGICKIGKLHTDVTQFKSLLF